MTEFVHNYFLSSRANKIGTAPRTPNNKKALDPKKTVALYLGKILESKVQKQLSLGLGKIMIEGFPRFTLDRKIILNKQSAFSTEVNSPKNLQVQPKPANTLTTGRGLLKKRSSLNETRMVSPTKTEISQGKLNPQRTYMPPESSISKQLNTFKMMQLSQQVKSVLQRISKYDKSNYATEIQKICKDAYITQIKKLEKIKNSSRDMRMLNFDNEFTMSALNNNVKVISELNKQVKQLRKANQQLNKQLKMIKQRSDREHKSSQKFEKHRGNVETVMKGYINRIQQHLDRRDLNKALIGINQFLKKYEKQDFAEEKVYFYCIIKDRINEHKDVEKCLDEICRILGVLCIADLSQTDACLRSLNANHTAFKYLKKTYGDIDKFYGKQMTNIMHNLENFNDNIIQYLEAVKKLEKQKNKPTGIQEIKKDHEEKVDQLQTRVQEQRRKAILLGLQLERKKFAINNLDPISKQTQHNKKIRGVFEKKLGSLMQKLLQKKDFKKQLDSIRKDEMLTKQKPYSQFIVLIDKLQTASDQKVKKQLEQISQIFTQISDVFKKTQIPQQNRFKEVQKLLDASSRKNSFYFDLHRFLNSMMFTIVHRTKEENNQQINKKSEQQISSFGIDTKSEKRRNRRMSQRIQDVGFDINSIIDGGKSCIVQRKGANRAASPPPTFVFYNRQQEDNNKATLNEKQLTQKLELFLNKVSPILHKSGKNMEDNLSQVQQLAETFVINNPKYKKIFTVIQNWMSFAISRLQLKQKK